MLECVVNISEGRDTEAIEGLARIAGGDLLDLHRDRHHNRSVLTLIGEDAPRRVAAHAVARLDIGTHEGVHPRIGVVDVVPFVALAGSSFDDAVAARDRFIAWAAATLEVPCFAYGPERSLPVVRREAFAGLAPTAGPDRPHRTAGAMAVGARPILVAYNVWLDRPDLGLARAVARSVRSAEVRALGLPVGDRVQVSMNLVEPLAVGPGAAYDRVARALVDGGNAAAGAELVGLVPQAVLDAEPVHRWPELGLGADKTIEARLLAAAAGG